MCCKAAASAIVVRHSKLMLVRSVARVITVNRSYDVVAYANVLFFWKEGSKQRFEICVPKAKRCVDTTTEASPNTTDQSRVAARDAPTNQSTFCVRCGKVDRLRSLS